MAQKSSGPTVVDSTGGSVKQVKIQQGHTEMGNLVKDMLLTIRTIFSSFRAVELPSTAASKRWGRNTSITSTNRGDCGPEGTSVWG